MHIMTTEAKTPRRHSDEFKARVLAQCAVPGASIAAVAQSHQLCVNLVHKWRRGRGAPKLTCAEPQRGDVTANSAFIVVPLAAPAELRATTPVAAVPGGHSAHIRIDLHRGALALSITWPTSAAQELTAWTRELLR
jgi:transposase